MKEENPKMEARTGQLWDCDEKGTRQTYLVLGRYPFNKFVELEIDHPDRYHMCLVTRDDESVYVRMVYEDFFDRPDLFGTTRLA